MVSVGQKSVWSTMRFCKYEVTIIASVNAVFHTLLAPKYRNNLKFWQWPGGDRSKSRSPFLKT